MDGNTNAEKLNNVSKRTKETLGQVSQSVKDNAESAVDATGTQAYKMGEMVREYCDHMQCYAKHGVDVLQGKTRKNPIMALAVAFAAGVIMHKLCSLNK